MFEEYLLPQAMLIEAPVFKDRRGINLKLADRDEVLVTLSEDNVIRGLHYQKKRPQEKTVRCLSGRIIDVCLDLRRPSADFGKAMIFDLDSPDKVLSIPKGYAHGFWSVSKSAVCYTCSPGYVKEFDAGINPFDDIILPRMPWSDLFLYETTKKLPPTFILSEKDKNLPSFREVVERELLPEMD